MPRSPTRKGPGAPSKQTPDREKRILDALKAGATRKAAAAYAGLSEDTFGRWMNTADFADNVTRAEAECEVRLTAIVVAAAATDWKAALAWLERRRAEDYARRSLLTLTLRDEAALVAAELGLDPADIVAEAERLTRTSRA